MFSIFKNSKNSFEGEKPYENTLILLRRHWFVLFIKILAYLIILFLPLFGYIFIHAFLAEHGLSEIFWFLFSVYLLIWWSSIFYAITMYLLDVWIVTDHRIIDSEQHGFFSRTTAEISLAKIQDISVAIRGVIPTFLDFGDLEVQSAGATEKFFFKEIPHPNQIRDLIMEAHNKFIEIHPNDIEVHEISSGV